MLYALQLNTQDTLPGMLANIVIASVLIAFIISIVALFRLRGAVKKLQAPHSPKQAPTYANAEPQEYLCSFVPENSRPEPLKLARSRMYRLARVYAIAGLCCSLTLTGATMVEARTYNVTLSIWLLAVYLWPLILTFHELAGWNWWMRRKTEIVYGCILLSLGIISQMLHQKTGVTQMALLFVLTNAAPTLLVLAYANRRVRSIGATVLPLCLAAFAGAFLLANLAATNNDVNQALVNVTNSTGVDETVVEIAVFVLGVAVMYKPGWLLMRLMARQYEARRFSAESLILDSMWLLFVASHAIVAMTPVKDASGGVILGIVFAFPVYLIVKMVGLRSLRRYAPPANTSPGLLVLRAFSLGRRAERTFDPVTLFWRYIGCVNLLGGQDLAVSTIQPHTFFNYLSGNLPSRFIKSADALEKRMGELDERPDPDGRFRINEFFCEDATWQLAVSRLISNSEVILADLCGFPNKSYGGVEFEIHEVLNTFPVEKFIVLVDGQTQLEYLAGVIKDAWDHLPNGSPNVDRKDRRIVFVEYAGSQRRTIPSVLDAIFRAASVPRRGGGHSNAAAA